MSDENQNEPFDIDRIMREADESMARMAKMEEEGTADIVKYFDRIHDKLFDLNNILIAGYFALVAINQQVSKGIIFVPVANLLFLIYVDYRMMEKSRLQSQITKVSAADRERYGRMINNTNLYSLLVIATTLTVTLVLIYVLYQFKTPIQVKS
ncbi:hypothetical protein ABDD95_17015 [Mucilaginibacter sp. PAMB04274]|uniref:hypothetical protein n=1 Tax=Mucilaginibacter sp. PAMB04274 TaxID=3138568 RepID=UPI0031F69EF1